MNVREKILNLVGETVLIVSKEEKNSFLADIEKVDKTSDTAVLNTIGPPGENRKECWSIDRIEDVVLVKEGE